MSPLVAARAAAAARGYGWGLSAGGPSGGFEAIATVTAAGGETSLSFTSIPQTYVALQIRGVYRDGADSALTARFNNDTAQNYTDHRLYGNGTSVTAAGYAAGTFNRSVLSLTGGVGASIFAGFITDILDYASTAKNKTVRSFYGKDENGSGLVGLESSLWISTSAISSITLTPYSGSFAAGTTFALYGIKGAA